MNHSSAKCGLSEALRILLLQFLNKLQSAIFPGCRYSNIFFLGLFLTLALLLIPFIPLILALLLANPITITTLKSKAPGRVVFTSPTVACLYLHQTLLTKSITSHKATVSSDGGREYREQFIVSRTFREFVSLHQITCPTHEPVRQPVQIQQKAYRSRLFEARALKVVDVDVGISSGVLDSVGCRFRRR